MFASDSQYSCLACVKMFPAISPSRRSSSAVYSVRMDFIEDLFYDGNDPEPELLKLQTVVDTNTSQLDALYNSGGSKGIDRKQFQRMAVKYVGQEVASAADEIFSNVTNLYGGSDNPADHDVAMSASQFVGGLVRLANLRALMLDGMVETSELAKQTDKFLKHIKQT